MNNTTLKSFLDELTKLSNTNVDGASNKNINSSKKPAKVPISKGAPSVAQKNSIPKVKVNKPNIPKYSFFKGADDKIHKIKAKYPPPPDSLKTEDSRMAWRLDQKYHKADLKAILEHDNKHQVLQVNTARLDSLPGDSLTFRQLFKGKK